MSLDTCALDLEEPGKRQAGIAVCVFSGSVSLTGKVGCSQDNGTYLPLAELAKGKTQGMWRKYAVKVWGGKKQFHPPYYVFANVSFSVGIPTPPLSECRLVKHSGSTLFSSLLCSFLFLVSISASFSDITFSLKIGFESYFCLLSRDLSSQTPTGCKKEFKTNPEEERKKLA